MSAAPLIHPHLSAGEDFDAGVRQHLLEDVLSDVRLEVPQRLRLTVVLQCTKRRAGERGRGFCLVVKRRRCRVTFALRVKNSRAKPPMTSGSPAGES